MPLLSDHRPFGAGDPNQNTPRIQNKRSFNPHFIYDYFLSRAGKVFDAAAAAKSYTALVFEWQTDFGNKYPTEPMGDAVAVSTALRSKWAPFFSTCAQ